MLARRAGSIRRRDAVGSWLYGVACRVAAHARGRTPARRRMLERYLAERARIESPTAEPPSEPMPELLEEVERLPERYRAPIVLCYLEGQSHEQAARVLGCPMRTVQTRLQRGKAKLRTRLVRRGLAPAAGLLAMGVESAEAATAVLAGVGAGGALGIDGQGVGAVRRVPGRRARHDRPRPGAGRAPRPSSGTGSGARRGWCFGLLWAAALTFFAIAAAGQKPEKPATTIAGRILDDQGRPIPGAEVWMPISFEDKPETTPHATADDQGHYALPVPEAWNRLPMRRVGTGSSGPMPPATGSPRPGLRRLSGKPESVDLTLGPATDTVFVSSVPTAGRSPAPWSSRSTSRRRSGL